MEPRDLDAQIVEKMFGWKLASVGKDYNGLNECEIFAEGGVVPEDISLPRIGKIHPAYLAPHYAGNFNCAMDLARHVKLPLMVYELPDSGSYGSAFELAKLCVEHWNKTSENKIIIQP